jgi:surface antigen
VKAKAQIAMATLLAGSAAMMAGSAAFSQSNPEDSDPPAATAYDFQPEPELPQIPAPPELAGDAYPECRDDHENGATYLDRADRINACTVALDTYYLKVLLPHREAMIVYQNELSRLYTQDVAPNRLYSEKSKNSFYQAMMRQHARANPDGAIMAQSRALEARYAADRAILEDRFCYNTGCKGYPNPVKAFPTEVKLIQAELMAEAAGENFDVDAAAARIASGASVDEVTELKSGKKPKSAKKAESNQGCKRARKRGGFLGSILGGAASAFGGLSAAQSALVAGFSGVVVGEIACQLDEEEKVEATKATVTVLEAEEVGATAEWISPTRQGVSGSSTVTALNTEPNGRRCLTITDVAIIDGAETRVEKQMCRASDGGQYMLVA